MKDVRGAIACLAAVALAGIAAAAPDPAGISTDWQKPVPAQSNYHSAEGDCPAQGAGGDTPTNIRKNRPDEPSEVHDVPVPALLALPYPNGAPHERKDWSQDQLAQIARYEGVGLRAQGFLCKATVEGKEECGCHHVSPTDVDWHLGLVAAAGQGEAQSVVVETTPRIRQKHPGWVHAKLTPVVARGMPVRITGWLMLDPEHPNMVGKARGTIWELHPVTRIEVQKNGAWVDLDNL